MDCTICGDRVWACFCVRFSSISGRLLSRCRLAFAVIFPYAYHITNPLFAQDSSGPLKSGADRRGGPRWSQF